MKEDFVLKEPIKPIRKKEFKLKTQDITKIAVCIALICISAYLSFPLPFSPAMVTAQTIVINLVALILTPKQALITVGLYILIGMLGLPVFSGGASGLAKIMSPTGGFILGFLIAAPLMSYVRGQSCRFLSSLLITSLIGMPVIYLIGMYWMSYVQEIGIFDAFKVAVLPFIFGDLVKCVMASLIAIKLNQAIKPSTIKRALVHE